MNLTTAARAASAVTTLTLALLIAGCSSETETTAPAASAAASVAASVKASVSGEACSAFAELKTSVEDLKSTPLDTSGTRAQIAAQAADLGVKAATVKANISRLSALSDGPVAAAVGELNEKADALSESLTLAVADGQEEIGPKITAAQSELDAAFSDVSTKVDAICPAG